MAIIGLLIVFEQQFRLGVYFRVNIVLLLFPIFSEFRCSVIIIILVFFFFFLRVLLAAIRRPHRLPFRTTAIHRRQHR